MYGVFNIELNEFISIFIYIDIVKNKKKIVRGLDI